jgi:hypothetical protein
MLYGHIFSDKRVHMKKNVFLSISLLTVGLVLLQGCAWFGGSCPSDVSVAKSGESVVKIGGKTVVTTDDFRDFLEAEKEKNPFIEQLLPKLPEDQQRMFYNQIAELQANAALLKKYADDQGWTATAEYRDMARRMHEQVEQQMVIVEFQKKLMSEFSPSDKDVIAYYEQNGATNPYLQNAPYVKKQGGVQAVAVKAKDEAQAKALVVSAKNRGLKKAAAEVGAKVEDLGIVNQQSTQPDRMVIAKLLSTKEPGVDMVKSDTSWWVYESLGKKESEYVPYAQLPEQAQEQVKNLMSNEYIGKAFQEKLSQMKEKPEYKVDINKSFVESFVVAQPASEQSAETKVSEAKAVNSK